MMNGVRDALCDYLCVCACVRAIGPFATVFKSHCISAGESSPVTVWIGQRCAVLRYDAVMVSVVCRSTRIRPSQGSGGEGEGRCLSFPTGLIPGQLLWDVLWANLHWDRFLL
jgi:hypothetical protein